MSKEKDRKYPYLYRNVLKLVVRACQYDGHNQTEIVRDLIGKDLMNKSGFEYDWQTGRLFVKVEGWKTIVHRGHWVVIDEEHKFHVLPNSTKELILKDFEKDR